MTDSPAMAAAIKALQGQAYKTAEELIEARAQAYMEHPEQLDMLERHVIRGEELSLHKVWYVKDRVALLYRRALTERNHMGARTALINLRAATRMLARLGDTDLPVCEAIKELQK